MPVVRFRVRKTLVMLALAFVLFAGPIMLARHLLELSRPDALVGDHVNYLAHQYVPREEKEVSPRLARLLQKEMHAVEAVPRIFLSRLPGTLPEVENAREKKRLFTSAMLPLILRANELIIADRGVLLSLKKKMLKGTTLRASERKWLQAKAKQYRVRRHGNFTMADIDLLIFRCDVIPPSLALAQAAMESGWGTSRFAQAGNALFGEWIWGDGDGLTPLEREEGKNHKVKSFDYLLDSVMSYMTNLNRHPSYRDLRLRRAELRQHNLPVTGAALAPSLVSYSERGADYVSDILTIINFNGLDGLDSAQLATHLEG